jgi:hypothetical protein
MSMSHTVPWSKGIRMHAEQPILKCRGQRSHTVWDFSDFRGSTKSSSRRLGSSSLGDSEEDHSTLWAFTSLPIAPCFEAEVEAKWS